ncbi:MAG: SIS domain-containing protein [Chloroflexia bacterium]|nr:SIS domain-containing protein [Chloroflexia bacterium]
MTRNGRDSDRRASLDASLGGYWDDLAALARALDPVRLRAAAELLLETQARGRVVFMVGNGGSAATASHFACDLAKGTRGDGAPTFRVMALTDNAPLLTAWANDAGYERVFAEQLRSLARPGDLLVAISASGSSPNIVAAVEAARSLRTRTLALTGRDGGAIGPLADLVVRVPSDRIEIVEDAHMAIAHSLCVAARAWLASPQDGVVHTVSMIADSVDLSA